MQETIFSDFPVRRSDNVVDMNGGVAQHDADHFDLDETAFTRSYEPTILYVEGTDACGKDSVADCVVMSSEENPLSPRPLTKRAGFFMADTAKKLDLWKALYPDSTYGSALLLAATALDLVEATKSESEMPAYVQVSHNAIRGAAHENAFGMPLADLFDTVTSMVPTRFWPVALETNVYELQRRVESNPHATPHDFLVCKQPQVIRKMLDMISEKCEKLGGVVIDTNHQLPDVIASTIATLKPEVVEVDGLRPFTTLSTGIQVMHELRSRKEFLPLRRVIDHVMDSMYVA